MSNDISVAELRQALKRAHADHEVSDGRLAQLRETMRRPDRDGTDEDEDEPDPWQQIRAGEHEKGGRCPVCDLELDDDLPHHLPECPDV